MQPTPVFLPEKSHGQRSLAVHSPQGCKTIGHHLVMKTNIITLSITPLIESILKHASESPYF